MGGLPVLTGQICNVLNQAGTCGGHELLKARLT